jgi:hypothetical protein
MTTVKHHLQTFLELHGEEAWRGEVQRLALAALRTRSEQHESFWRDLTKDYEWLDWNQLKAQIEAEVPSASPDRLIAEVFKSQMPGIKSQAQYDAAVGALEAAKLVINTIVDPFGSEQDARRVLDVAFDAVRKATELTLKLEDSPEGAMSTAAQQFKNEPAQFVEANIHRDLMLDLLRLKDLAELNAWYASTKPYRDKIVTQSLRNELLDAIRAKRNSWCVQCRNPHYDGCCTCGRAYNV